MQKKVLITGISGFVGQHAAVELIKQGYQVKGSLRNLSKANEVTKGIEGALGTPVSIEFCELDLLKDQGWYEAMEGCDYVLHIASPFVIADPKREEDVIEPAVNGTLRALKAAAQAGVKKLVLTSSTVAMAGDKKQQVLNQDSWSNPATDRISVYMKSKTLAEKAAWDFYHAQKEGDKLEMTVINPGPIYGPTLTGNLSGESMSMIKNMITGKMPQVPKASYVMSDVRDIAKIHVKALEEEKSNGKRFIVTSNEAHSFSEIAKILKQNGYKKASDKQAPSLLLKLMSNFNKDIKGLLPFVDANIQADISPTQQTFNWEPIPFEKTILDSAQSVSSIIWN